MASLPNARNVSRELFPQSPGLPWEQSPNSADRTTMAAVFGQFLTHDITLTRHEGPPNCEGKCFEAGTGCFGIPVSDDTVFNSRNIDCIPMTRATTCQNGASGAEQVNIATSYIDASHIYGNNDAELSNVRADPSSNAGQLRMESQDEHPNLGNLLPASPPSVFCRSPDHVNMPCRRFPEKQR